MKPPEPKRQQDHYELGGSNAERWSNCTGSVFLNRTVPKLPAGPAAIKGTKEHLVSGNALRAFLNQKVTGEPFADPNKNNADDEMVNHATEYVKAIWKQALHSSITNKAWGVEDLFMLSEHLQMGGTIDFWAVYINDKAQREGLVCDLKTGMVLVSEKKNAQLAFYACALRHFIRSKGKDLDLVRVAIFQPSFLEEKAFRSSTLNSKQLDAWETKFTNAAHSIYYENKSKFKTGPQCKWCASMAVCPRYAKDIKVKTDLALLNVKKVVLPRLETMSDRQLRGIALHGDLLIDFVKACRSHCINRFLNGKPVENTKVIEAKGRRGWLPNDLEIGERLKEEGIAEPWNFKLKGIGVIEKALGKKKDIIAEWTKTSPSRPVLVDGDDERPAVINGVELLMASDDED